MSAPLNILVRGGGITAPLAALYLSRLLPESRARIGFEATDQDETAGAFAVLPDDIRSLHRLCRIKEADFIRQSEASFHLGFDLRGFGPAPYLNVNSNYGALMGGSAFHLAMIAAGRTGPLSDWEAATLPARMIRTGRFTPPQPRGPALLANYGYGYHVDPGRYADVLRGLAPSRADKAPDFIIETDAPAAFDHQSPLAALGLSASAESRPRRLAMAATHTATAGTIVVDSPSAAATTRTTLTVGSDGNLGRVGAAWTGKTIRLGPASGHLPPLMALPGRFLAAQLKLLGSLIPASGDGAVEAREYSRLSARLHDRFDDFAQLLLATSGQAWAERIELSGTAAHKFALFKARGRIAILDDDELLQDHYVPMLLGNGVWPKRVDVMAARQTPDQVADTLGKLEASVANIVRQLPAHDALLAKVTGRSAEMARVG